MVRRRHNRHQYHGRVPDAQRNVKRLPTPPFAYLAFFERPPEDAGVVDHGAADAEGVAEMHARHRGERVDVVARHEDAGGVVVADRVQEAVFGREQARRHAGVEGECEEGEEVGQGEGAADCGEGGEGGRDVVVPCDETVGSRIVQYMVMVELGWYIGKGKVGRV